MLNLIDSQGICSNKEPTMLYVGVEWNQTADKQILHQHQDDKIRISLNDIFSLANRKMPDESSVKTLICVPENFDARKFEKKAVARFVKASFGSPSGLSHYFGIIARFVWFSLPKKRSLVREASPLRVVFRLVKYDMKFNSFRCWEREAWIEPFQKNPRDLHVFNWLKIPPIGEAVYVEFLGCL